MKRRQREMRAKQQQLSQIRNIDSGRLSHASLALWDGAVKLQPLPSAAIGMDSPSAARVQSAPVDAMADTTYSLAFGTASSQLGTAYSLTKLGFDLIDIYLVGSGRATPSHLKRVVPHVAFACQRLGMSLDPRDPGAAIMATTPMPHLEPGLEHGVVDSWAHIDVRQDALTDTLISTTHDHITTRSRMNGREINAYLNRLNRNQRVSIPQVQPVPSPALQNLFDTTPRHTVPRIDFPPPRLPPVQPPPRIPPIQPIRPVQPIRPIQPMPPPWR
ncbi:MAG: hypothetical protein ACYS0G_06395 [Planctomycetota bacterium]